MQLYIISATPERNASQVQSNMATRLEELNAKAHATYSSLVADKLSLVGIEGFSISPINGYWKGKAERSYKIEVATDNKQSIYSVAQALKDAYRQDAVMVTNPDNSVLFI